MKYTKDLTDLLLHSYTSTQLSVPECAEILTLRCNSALIEKLGAAASDDPAYETVPERSVIAKLSSLGVYRKKEYLTKRGEIPVKKDEYIERIAKLLDVQSDFLESLEKVNKGVLALIATKLSNSDPKLD